MQWKSVILGAAAGAALLLSGGSVFPGDGTPKGAPNPDDMKKMLQPGPQHEALKAYEGTWEGTGTYTEAGRPPVPFTATGTYTMILEGRYLQIEEEMKIGAVMTITSRAFIAYDNVRKKYVHFSMDNYTTQPTYAEGDHDDAKKALVLRGVEHVVPGTDRKFRTVTGDIEDNTFKAEAFFDEGAGEHKAVEATYKRQK